MPDDTARRKDAHLDLCASDAVEPEGNDPLFGDVHLLHEALPELAESEVDLGCSFLGKRLAAPILVTGMTGGTERAGAINRGLAQIADELGLAFGVGSQRAMLAAPEAIDSYAVREVAPRVALLGNLGLWQARSLGVDGVRRLVDAIRADGMAVHLNVAQEMVQPEGDRDFRDGLETLRALAAAFGDRLVVKETGCGMAPGTVRALVDAGVKVIDVSGLGGTSWVRVEALRARGESQSLGMAFSGWGIPTAASVRAARLATAGHARIIASGGMRDGLMAAKAIALGAELVGLALPAFRAWERGGSDSVRAFLQQFVASLKLAMVLTGSKTSRQLAARPLVLTGALAAWVSELQKGLDTLATREANP